MNVMSPHLLRRIEEKCVPEPNTGCWLWCAASSSKGYGCLGFGGKMLRAHRVVLSHKIGRPLESHELACHACDQPSCVNPDHLWVGSSRDNLADMRAKGRHAQGSKNGMHTKPWRRSLGDRNGMRHSKRTRLNHEKASEIRSLYGSKRFSQRQLAQRFGVSRRAIQMIVNGTIWATPS